VNSTGDPLAALNPLREPPPVGWWPPAPGWWLLLALVLLGLGALVYTLYRRRRARAYRKQAARQVAELYESWARTGDSAAFAAAVNALLKSVAVRAYPREQVAAIHGRQWAEFLNSSAPGGPDFDNGFTRAVYTGDAGELDIEALHAAALHWIRHHRVPA